MTNDTETIAKKSLFDQVSESFQNKSESGDSALLQEKRQRAFRAFEKVGFPTVKNEEWKYTNIHHLVNHSYTLENASETGQSTFTSADIPHLETYKIVLRNGDRPAIASEDFPEGVIVRAISESTDELHFQQYFAEFADKSDNPFVQLNTALYTEGVYIYLQKNVVLDKPIHIVHVADSAEESTFSQTRNLVILDNNAELELIESFVTEEGSEKNLHNKVSEIVLFENAKIQHYSIQTAGVSSHYFNHIEVYQKQHSLYNNYNCIFPGASFIRNNINVRLDDENVESHLYGINLLSGKQLVDNHTIVDHLKPHCESYEWYKNIPQEESTAVFNGKIFVREDAQKTNAFQQNNNMLIGDKSAVYTKPQLEIFADDVKCSHGCTMGQFDDEALFYLRARGIGEDSARTLLVHAFAYDVTTRFSNEKVRDYVENLVAKGLQTT